jgi:hypothetical protein
MHSAACHGCQLSNSARGTCEGLSPIVRSGTVLDNTPTRAFGYVSVLTSDSQVATSTMPALVRDEYAVADRAQHMLQAASKHIRIHHACIITYSCTKHGRLQTRSARGTRVRSTRLGHPWSKRQLACFGMRGQQARDQAAGATTSGEGFGMICHEKSMRTTAHKQSAPARVAAVPSDRQQPCLDPTAGARPQQHPAACTGLQRAINTAATSSTQAHAQWQCHINRRCASALSPDLRVGAHQYPP